MKIINIIISFFKKLFNIKEKSIEKEIEIMKYDIEGDNLIFRTDKGKENYSQRNNKFIWVHPKNPALKMDGLSMCNVTSMVMALDYAGYFFPKGKFDQPEDNLCDFMFTDKRVMDKYKEWMPAMYAAFERGDTDAYCPNLIHAVLAYATNLWLGTTAITFKEKAPITDILKEIMDGRPVVMSGTFPYKYANGKIGTIGHINTIVGIIFSRANQNKLTEIVNKAPDFILIDDPYGSYSQNFLTGTGNDVKMPYTDFVKYYKTLGDNTHKMAHFIKPGAALI